MPYRRTLLVNKQFYHIFNQSVGSEDIFRNKNNFKRAISLIDYYHFPQPFSYSEFLSLDRKSRDVNNPGGYLE